MTYKGYYFLGIYPFMNNMIYINIIPNQQKGNISHEHENIDNNYI